MTRRAGFVFLLCMATSSQGVSRDGADSGTVTRHDAEKAFPGYVLFDALDGRTHLVDLQGCEVRSWDRTGFPSEMIAPSARGGKGNIFVNPTVSPQEASAVPEAFRSLYGAPVIAEADWDGRLVWQWRLPENARQHHDWERLPNGNTVLIASVTRKIAGFPLPLSNDQAIFEVTPAGQIAWSWFAGDHIDELGLSAADRLVLQRRGPGGPGFLGLNGLAALGPNRWFDGGDMRFRPDNLIFTSRITNIIAIVDRRTGHIVWKIGPDYAGRGAGGGASADRPVDQISAGQAAYMIPKGMPGGGNILLFDDQGPSGITPVALDIFRGSRVIEIDPVSRSIVWQYSAEDSGQPAYAMHAFYGGNAQRLPNGNTMINTAFHGRVIQVTPEGEIVWEYRNPYTGSGRVKDPFLNRVQFVPPDWLPGAVACPQAKG